jgi:hypothetical protein
MKTSELNELANRMYADYDIESYLNFEGVEHINREPQRDSFKVGFRMGYQQAMEELKEKTLYEEIHNSVTQIDKDYGK